MTTGSRASRAGAALSHVAGRRSPRRRAQVARGIQYALLLAAAVGLALATDWQRVTTSLLNPQVARDMLPTLGGALVNTLRYTAAAFAVGLSLGTVLALMKLSSVRPYRWIATAYIEFFRGIPALLVVVAFGFAVPVALGTTIPSLTLKAALALGMVAAAYIAETLRAGIEAVPRGQVEAARSLGMSHVRTLVSVVVPQAFRIVLPPMTNEVILLTKDTSLIYLLGLTQAQYDLTKLGRDALSTATGGLTALFVVGACYLVITIPLGVLARRLEVRTARRSRP